MTKEILQFAYKKQEPIAVRFALSLFAVVATLFAVGVVVFLLIKDFFNFIVFKINYGLKSKRETTRWL